MTRKCASSPSVTKPRARTSLTELSVEGLETLADAAVIDLFNIFSVAVRKRPPGRDIFQLRSKDITRNREIVSTWVPQMYEPGQSREDFDVPYVLGSFFNRYISVPEKKVEKTLQAKAAKKFLETNLDGAAIDDYILEHPTLSPLITKMRYHIGRLFQEEFRVTDLYHLTGHGPNSTTTIDFQNAFLHNKNLDCTGTSASLQQLVHYLSWDKDLQDIVVSQSPELWNLFIFHEITPEMLVNYTKTSFVPKKFDSLRTMCPEPTTVAFFAQMMARMLTVLLSRVGINLNTQPECHKHLARLGSLFKELFIATIDWSEASDRIWTALVRAVMTEGFAPQYFDFMNNVCRVGQTELKWVGVYGSVNDFGNEDELRDYLAAHTDTFTVKNRKQGRYVVTCTVETTMFATMGNPVTFPLQTLIFWAFLQSCTELAQESDSKSTSIDEYHFPSSFGDDGIVDSRAMDMVVKYADLLNWKLNKRKSFSSGSFRESCGGDYYSGRYCRPFEPKRPPLDHNQSLSANKKLAQAWLYICANNVSELCAALGGNNELISIWLERYHRLMQLGKICLVPPSYPDGSGYRTGCWTTGLQDRSSLLLEVPERWRGHGYEGPWVSFTPPDSSNATIFKAYHEPYFSWTERKIFFKALQSVPGTFIPITGVEDHYYHFAMKSNYSGYEAEIRTLSKEGYDLSVFILDWTPKLDFFSMDRKKQAQLRNDGSLTYKECKLYKAETSVLSWD